MKNLSTSQRIEKALGHLRQRYGVSGGLTSEPKIIEIRNGPRVVFNVASLKAYNEDLNTLEIFAYAHNEVEKLSGQLILDTANRLPGVLKRRYLDYLIKIGRNLNHPGFDSLRDFIVHELNVVTMLKHFLRTMRKTKLANQIVDVVIKYAYGKWQLKLRRKRKGCLNRQHTNYLVTQKALLLNHRLLASFAINLV